MKRALIAGFGLLCVQAHAEEAGFPPIRVGDSWQYTGHHDTRELRRSPLHFEIEVEGPDAAGGYSAIHRDPRIPVDQQIGQLLSPIPAGSCVRDILTGLELLSVSDCASLPRKGTRWKRDWPGEGNRIVRLEIRYAGRKRIKVPAGTFRAHRFDVYQLVSTNLEQMELRRRYWYAPEVRGMVLMESESIDVLGRRGNEVYAALSAFEAAP